MKIKKHLFSVLSKDCRWDFYRASGAGGQKRNKTASAVRCTHLDSGAVGNASDTRSQHKNKITAFKRMADTEKFKVWHRVKAAELGHSKPSIDELVEQAMASEYLKIEIKDDGKWRAI